jgi:hypothetical protein
MGFYISQKQLECYGKTIGIKGTMCCPIPHTCIANCVLECYTMAFALVTPSLGLADEISTSGSFDPFILLSLPPSWRPAKPSNLSHCDNLLLKIDKTH